MRFNPPCPHKQAKKRRLRQLQENKIPSTRLLKQGAEEIFGYIIFPQLPYAAFLKTEFQIGIQDAYVVPAAIPP
ncbi:MAG: hypothetical protein GY862_38035 [Gammaproteobacteria bacterium]|nr:hypothetical protein [Gammaproteobacteria bacterium]